MARRGRRGNKRSWTLPIIVVLVAVTVLVGYLIFTQSVGPTSDLNGKPVSPEVMRQVAGVSANTLTAVGKAPVGSPRAVAGGAPLTYNGKPGVLYVGGDFCPFCATERWSMVIALSKFGNFSGLQYMQSSGTDIYASTSTFTFANSSFTSNYLTFVAVEQKDRNQQVVRQLTPDQTALMNQYNTNGSIPFVDIGNRFILTGSQTDPKVLRVGGSATGAPLNWTAIASQLDNPNSPIAQSLDGAANKLISAICVITNNQPSNVCSQSFAQTLDFLRTPGSTSGSLMMAGAWSLDSPRSRPAVR